jgi:hypothetical protein
MEFDFEKSMQQTSDEELIRIITVNRGQYTPEAVTAADNEFKKRRLAVEMFDELKTTYEEEQAIAEEKANMPLEPVMKVIAFLFAAVIFWFVGRLYAVDGYERKATEFRKWALFGFLFYVVIAVIVAR